MAHEEIYGLLMKSATLLEAHSRELTEKRGFSQDTIKRFGFGSGGDHLLGFETVMIERVKNNEIREQDLISSGVFIHDGRSARINPVLIREKNSINGKDVSNVLIPYHNLKGDIYLVRPHKLGLTGVPIEVYQESNLTGNPPEIILTEGEFKAVAAMQYGFQTIAVPGISSFSEKEWPRFLKILKDHGTKRVVIVFDNETKNDPNFPNYKDNPYDRYDTQFYAYYMATRLDKEGIEVAIATLPNIWKVNGKIDIDGAAAQLRTQGEMKKIFYDALPRPEYLHSLDTEARQSVQRKMTQKFHRSRIKREFNRYIVTRQKGKTTWDEPISNFVMKLLATHETPEGTKREIEFVNEIGKRSGSITMPANCMSSSDAFRTFALDHGDFVWRGSTEDLLTIWESEFLMMDEGRTIYESDHIGWIGREKIWIFGNVAIKSDGSLIRPDQNGIFWLEKRGVKPMSLSSSNGKDMNIDGIPQLYLEKGIDISEIRKKLSDTIGPNEACILLGWVTAVAFMEEIFFNYRSFPFLFVTGRWQSGKSTVSEWITNFFGMEDSGKSISQTTAVAIQRCLSYYSCLPTYLDEYRNTKDIKYKEGFLRNVYNRQGAGKGVKDSAHALRDVKVRGTLLITGEETPKDGGLLSRGIILFVSSQKRVVNHISWFNRERRKFSCHFLDILKRKFTLQEQFMLELAEWKAFFTAKSIEDRMALNYATVMAGHAIIFGRESLSEDDVKFGSWLVEETKTVQAEAQEEQAVSVFLDDLMALKTQGKIDDKYWAINGNKIYIYFHGLHQQWAEQFRKVRGEEAFKEGSVRSYLKEEKGYVDANTNFRIKGQMKKCMVFNYEESPEDLKNLVVGCNNVPI